MKHWSMQIGIFGVFIVERFKGTAVVFASAVVHKST